MTNLWFFVFMLPGIVLTSWFGTQIQHKTGVSATELVPFVLGILLVAWSPVLRLTLLSRELQRRLQAHEERLAKEFSA
jgi:hypothetical protein